MMSTNLYSSFMVALAVAATAAVTGCAAGEAAADADAPELLLQSTSLPSSEATPPGGEGQPWGYASTQRSSESQYERAGAKESGSSSYGHSAYPRGGKEYSESDHGAPQGIYAQEPGAESGQPQQGQYGQPQQGQYGQPGQGQYGQPQQGQYGQPGQGLQEQPQQGQQEQPCQGQREEPQQGQSQGCSEGNQGEVPPGELDEPGVDEGPIPSPCLVPTVTYPVFFPVPVAYPVPVWGSFYGLGYYPYGGLFLGAGC